MVVVMMMVSWEDEWVVPMNGVDRKHSWVTGWLILATPVRRRRHHHHFLIVVVVVVVGADGRVVVDVVVGFVVVVVRCNH